ncbi:MAG: zinc ribbon domain-containing protein [Actinobacteria bacterium]|nr:MAG: zinc ribbon domain-containing protein [Actinomycetota bacterium]
MPVFEYKCSKCNHFFEELIMGDKKVKCPKCSSEKIKKKFSTFSKRGDGDFESSSSACSSCSSSNCGSCNV